jgi:hypothetical protein
MIRCIKPVLPGSGGENYRTCQPAYRNPPLARNLKLLDQKSAKMHHSTRARGCGFGGLNGMSVLKRKRDKEELAWRYCAYAVGSQVRLGRIASRR